MHFVQCSVVFESCMSERGTDSVLKHDPGEVEFASRLSSMTVRAPGVYEGLLVSNRKCASSYRDRRISLLGAQLLFSTGRQVICWNVLVPTYPRINST